MPGGAEAGEDVLEPGLEVVNGNMKSAHLWQYFWPHLKMAAAGR